MNSYDKPSTIFSDPPDKIASRLPTLDDARLNSFLNILQLNLESNPKDSVHKLFSIFQELSKLLSPSSLTQLLLNVLIKAHRSASPDSASFIEDYSAKNYLSVDPESLKILHSNFPFPYEIEDFLSYSSYLILIGQYQKAVTLLIDFQLVEEYHKKYDLLTPIISNKQTNLLSKIIKKNAKLSYESIEILCKNKCYNLAEEIIIEYKFDPSSFPTYLKKTKKRSIKFFILEDKLDIFHLIELAGSDPISLAALIEVLIELSETKPWMNTIAQALLQMTEKNSYLSELAKSKMVSSSLFQLTQPADFFSPVLENCQNFPQDIPVYFISNPSDIAGLSLENQTFAGVDSEWRTVIGGKLEKTKTSILQIAFPNVVYLIDLLAKEGRRELDKKLFQFFGNADILKIGVAFGNDFAKFRESHPDLECFNGKIHSYLDLLNVHKRHFKNNPGGLGNLCEIHLGVPFCKSEQKSNWENRPLRMRQVHYAALDAYVCIELYKSFYGQGIFVEEDVVKSLSKEEKNFNQLELVKKTCDICKSRLHVKEECFKVNRCEFCGFLGHKVTNCPCVVEIKDN